MAKNKLDGKFIDAICGGKLEYLFLASLISSDNILTTEDAKKSLKYIDKVEKALEDATISEEKKEEFKNYIEKGRDILKKDIERFNKN
jgi:molecular chaperone DnaK (HSP70)